MPTAEKTEKVDQLAAAIAESKSMVLADFAGIDVAAVTELRSQFRAASVDYRVVKNRLAKRAVAAAGLSGLEEFFDGPTAVAFAREDPLAAAQVMQKFLDGGGKMAIKSGFLDGQVLSPDQVKALAALPSRDELLAQVTGAVQGPLVGFVRVLNGLLQNLVRVISAIEEQQRPATGEEAAGEPE